MRFMRLLAALAAASASAALAAPTIGGCPTLPADNVWNARVDTLPVHARSAQYVANVAIGGAGATRPFHMDFGSGLYPDPPDPEAAPIGIPFVVVGGSQPKVPVVFDEDDESDPGPYPIPPNAPIEGVGPPNVDGDRHVLVIDTANCILYETFYSFPQGGGASWEASSGAKYDLRSNALRPSTWTSADAAGLPIFPGLVRYEEVAAGVIEHALRFTAQRTQRAFVWPARHFASSITDLAVPPMGARFRLKASVNINGYSPQAKVIAQAMKTYGIILADNGSPWYVSGAPHPGWDNDVLHELDDLRGSDFEAVDTSALMVNPNSGRVAPACGGADTDNDGIPDCIEPGEGRNAGLKDNDIFASARLFAMQQFRDFVAREGLSGGITYWTNQVNASFPRARVIESFFDSAEFQGTVVPVARLYFAYFQRIPDYGGVVYWSNYFRDGSSLAAISDQFSQSAEFTTRYGTLSNEEFVDLLYRNVLGRPPDAGGLAYWSGELNAGRMTRGEVMLGFSESAEYRGNIANEVAVTTIYAGLLRRVPAQGGLSFWVGHLDGGGAKLTLIEAILASTEYHARFLPP